jgi:hypothetical protein
LSYKTPKAGLASEVFYISIKQGPSPFGLSVIADLTAHNSTVGSRDISLMYGTVDSLTVTAFDTDTCFVGTITMLTRNSVTREQCYTRNACHIISVCPIHYFQVLVIGVPRHIEAKIHVGATQVLTDIHNTRPGGQVCLVQRGVIPIKGISSTVKFKSFPIRRSE